MKLSRTSPALITASFLMPVLLLGSQVAPPVPRDRELPDSSGEQQKPGSKEQQKSGLEPWMKPGFHDADPRLQSYSRFALLTQYPAVQDALELSSTQKDGIQSIQSKVARFREMTAKRSEEIRQQADPVTKAQARLALREETGNFSAAAEAAALKVLNSDQRRRLDEILLQAEGPLALLRADVQQRLNMDELQIANITAIVNQGRAAMDETEAIPPELRKHLKADPENPTKIITDPAGAEEIKAYTKKRFQYRLKLRGSISREIYQALRKRQRTLYDKMRGEPFDLMELRQTRPSTVSKPEQATKPSTNP